MRSHARFRLAAVVFAPVLAWGAAVPAAAGHTWTIRPGGNFTATGTISLDASGSSLASCAAKAKGHLKSGSGLPGTDVGKITSLTVSKCTVDGFGITVTARLPWTINLIGYDPAEGTTTGSLTGVDFTLSTTGCSATVAGPSGGSSGSEEFQYGNGTHKLTLLPTSSNLHYEDVTGCFGLISDGQAAGLDGTLTITPAQTITSS
jgi:hypothetical protein